MKTFVLMRTTIYMSMMVFTLWHTHAQTCSKILDTSCLPERLETNRADLDQTEEAIWSGFPSLLLWEAFCEFQPW